MKGCSVTSLTVSFALHGANGSSAGLVLRMDDFFDRLMSDRDLLEEENRATGSA